MMYFAYGSNTKTAEMQRPVKCPTAVFRGAGYLLHYTLVFNKRSTRWGVAANIEPKYGDTVYGVLYEIISEEESAALDAEEKRYHRIDVKIRVLPDRRLVDAFTYEADKDALCDGEPVRKVYLDLLIDGAREHGLPDEYTAILKSFTQEE